MHAYLSDAPDAVVLATAGHQLQIAVASTEAAAVRRAAGSLRTDLEKVTASTVRLTSASPEARIVVGTLGVSPLIDQAVAEGRLDPSPLLDSSGSPVWEAFLVQLVDEQLYLVGADRRGTVYAVYDFCEAIGVSPWWWWGDVPVRHRDQIAVHPDAHYTDRPSVQYRGIFINDEEELDNWARAHTADGTIGPETYERIFELVLRLKGNYVWPAMHVNAFNHDPANGRLADEMGIVIGSSHCDILLRSNEHEFATWAADQDEPVSYDYSIPGRNQELIRAYWRDSVRQNRDYEVSWTLGMRGIHDSGFITSAIDVDETLSNAERHRAKVDLLGQAIHDQRTLLTDELGDHRRDSLQLFIPYKEVLPLYDDGLDLPDDITIVWANDNFGYIRRFPSAEEQMRPGGHGLYYHSSYWSQPPRSYLATSSTPLALTRHELRRAWQHGIRKLWVNNIGGLKPLELETEYFLRLAWQAGRESTTSDVVGFIEQWVNATFSGEHGAQAGQIYARYYQLNNQRKIEHLDTRSFSQTGYGDEAFRRLALLRELYDKTTQLLLALPTDERDAFFQLFAVKIHLSYLVNAQFAYADRSMLAYRQGRFAAADAYVGLSRSFDAHKRALLHSYNHVIAGGKWNHILTPEQAPPPAMALHPAATPALRIGAPGLDVALWGAGDPGAHTGLHFWPYGTATKWIDVFTTGTPGLPFDIDCDDWIEVSDKVGVLAADHRITVGVPNFSTAAGRTGTVTVRAAGQTVEIPVTVAALPALADGFTGSIEADECLSLDAGRPDARHGNETTGWVTLPWLGRDANPVLESRGASGATAEYRLHLVTPGAHLLELHRLPTLDSTGRIRVGVSVDDQPCATVESPTTDEYRGNWKRAVLDNVERLQLRLPYLDEGAHMLRLHAIDAEVAFSKLVIYTSDRQPTNLGPRVSHHTARPLVNLSDPDPAAIDLGSFDRVARDIYRVDPGTLPPPPAVYTTAGYHEGGQALVVPQSHLGAPRLLARSDGAKDIINALGSETVLEQDGRIGIEAEYALVGTTHAWTTPGQDGAVWSHLHAETNGGTGLAMWVDAPGRRWDDPRHAPGLHYAVDVTTPGTYRTWLLVKFNHKEDDACWLALDGAPLPEGALRGGGQFFGWDSAQRWHWASICDLELSRGRHTISILAREAGLRIDRIYLTTGNELPPADADWEVSAHADRHQPAPPVLETTTT